MGDEVSDVVECICGGDIKPFTLDGRHGWIHLSTLDDRCYPDAADESDRSIKGEPDALPRAVTSIDASDG